MTHPTTPAHGTGAAAIDGYAQALDDSNTPLLGHLVLYSIYQGTVTRDNLVDWFTELNLDLDFVPPPLRKVDAVERITGRDGVKCTYPVDRPTLVSSGRSRSDRRRDKPGGTTATLMIRFVRRDGEKIVYHVVREQRDELQTKLSYKTHMADVIFRRNYSQGAAEGDGTLDIAPNNKAINKLGEAEAATVRTMLDQVATAFDDACTFLSSDRLRAVVRAMLDNLDAVRIQRSGYFVPRQHVKVLAGLRELVARFGSGSQLTRIPLPDQDEMREMVTTAFVAKASTDLEKLAADIAAATRDERLTPAKVTKLHHRFTALKEATAAHTQLLSTSLDDTTDAMNLVQTQLISLLTAATDDPDEDHAEEDDPGTP